jgi:hypothetical protein
LSLPELIEFLGRHQVLSLALAGITLALVATEVARLFRGY